MSETNTAKIIAVHPQKMIDMVIKSIKEVAKEVGAPEPNFTVISEDTPTGDPKFATALIEAPALMRVSASIAAAIQVQTGVRITLDRSVLTT